MKIVLYILIAVVCLLFLLLFLPLTVDLNFKDKLLLKIKYSGITFFNNQKRVRINKKRKKSNAKTIDDTTPTEENFLKRTYKQKGLLGTVEYFSKLLAMFLKRFRWIIRQLNFRKFNLNLSVATSDAANTAVQYGKICSMVYPVLSFLYTNAHFKAKEVNISADFSKTKSEFQVSLSVTTRLIFWLIAAIAVFFEFLKLQRKESEKYERKQH